MSLFDNLKSFIKVKVDLSNLKEINIFSGVNINSNNDNRKVSINLADIQGDAKRRAELLAIVRQALTEESALVIDRQKNEVVEDFSKFESLPATQRTLEFFKGKISTHDHNILRAALYIKQIHESGRTVSTLKSELISRYGDRGKNISNLCSAGYFETYLRPLYEEMVEQDSFEPLLFQSRFDVLIDDFPNAVFVNSHMVEADIKAKILHKYSLAKRYGIGRLNIHGIGYDNVRRIEAVLSDPEIRAIIQGLPTIDRSGSSVAISISL